MTSDGSLGKANGPSSAFLVNITGTSWVNHTPANVTGHGHGAWYLEVVRTNVSTMETMTVYAGATVRGSSFGSAAYSLRVRVGRSDCLATFWTSGTPQPA